MGPVPPAPEGSVYYSPGGENCVLPCHVELSKESEPTSIPHVTWFFESNDESFVPLNNSEFWKKEYKKHYCGYVAYPFPDFREYSGPSHFNCVHHAGQSESNKTSYDCSLEHHHCFLGTYKCKVTMLVGDIMETVKEATTRVIG